MSFSVGTHEFTSRLIVGTGKYPDFECMKDVCCVSSTKLELTDAATGKSDMTHCARKDEINGYYHDQQLEKDDAEHLALEQIEFEWCERAAIRHAGGSA